MVFVQSLTSPYYVLWPCWSPQNITIPVSVAQFVTALLCRLLSAEHREQLADGEAQPAEDKLPLGDIKGRLLPAVRRQKDRLWPARQHHQNVGQKLTPVHKG